MDAMFVLELLGPSGDCKEYHRTFTGAEKSALEFLGGTPEATESGRSYHKGYLEEKEFCIYTVHLLD